VLLVIKLVMTAPVCSGLVGVLAMFLLGASLGAAYGNPGGDRAH